MVQKVAKPAQATPTAKSAAENSDATKDADQLRAQAKMTLMSAAKTGALSDAIAAKASKAPSKSAVAAAPGVSKVLPFREYYAANMRNTRAAAWEGLYKMF